MDTGLAEKTVVVTGANANIGRAICLGFAAENAKLVVVGRDTAQGERVCRQTLEHGAKDALWTNAMSRTDPRLTAWCRKPETDSERSTC